MSILQTQPDRKEACVKRVHPLMFAAEGGQEKDEEFFENFKQHDAQLTLFYPQPAIAYLCSLFCLSVEA
jgi:hypothetical protein